MNGSARFALARDSPTRVNVYVPDELAERARAAGLNLSALIQGAIAYELQRRATDAWLASLPEPRRAVSHGAVMAALDDARAEIAGEPDA